MNLVTDPRAIAVSDGGSEASSSGSYSRSSYTSRSSMDDLLERALLHGFDHANRTNRVDQRGSYAASPAPGPSHTFDQVNIFQRPRRSGLPGAAQRGLRQRMDVHVDSSGGPLHGDDADDEALGLLRRAAHQQREATSMERFRQTLEEMRARAFGSEDAHTTSAGDTSAAPAAKKPRRKPDAGAQARLFGYNASMKAKQQEKYADRVAREAAERLARRPPHVSQAAQLTGRRLHSQAKAQERIYGELREARQKEQEAEEEKACTFEPTITAYARRLSEQGGYVDPQERLEREADRKEALQRQRLEKEAAAMRACPFHPTLAPHSKELIAAQRQAHRSRSRRRDDAAPGAAERSSHEPFEAGERLYREGGERLLRRQIRQRLAERQAEAERVGQRVVLSSARAHHVTDRLDAWQRAKTRNLDLMRQDTDHAGALGRGTTTASRPLSRSQSVALTDRLSAPKRASAGAGPSSVASSRSRPASASTAGRALSRASSQGSGTGRAACAGDRVRRAASAGAHSAATTTSQRRQAQPPLSASSRPLSRSASQHSALSRPTATGASFSSRGSSPLRDTSVFRGRWSAQGLTPEQATLQHEFRRIRFGALFYKYAPTPSSETLCCRDVRRQVRLYYPEDTGVAEALRLSVSGELVPVSKSAFVAALELYESNQGPQPWGRTEKDKLLFPMAATGASADTTRTTARPRSAPLSRQSSAASSSKGAAPSVAVPSVSRPRSRGSVGAMSRTSSRTRDSTTSATRRRLPGQVSVGEMEKCTFRPTLSAQTQKLSEIDRQRRASYAAERELRLRELQLLRALNHSSSRDSEPQLTTPRASASATGTALNAPNAAPPAAPPVAGAGRSPSVELSSLSGSSPSSLERSAAAIAAVVARRAQKGTDTATTTAATAPPKSNTAPPAAAAKARATDAARRELEALLLGYNRGDPTPPPSATPASATLTAPPPLPHRQGAPVPTERVASREATGFAAHPTTALLSTDADHHAARPPRGGEAAVTTTTARATAPGTPPSLGVSPNRCNVDDLYNVLYKRSWF